MDADNCLAAMVGKERLRELERNRTMVVTGSWICRIYLDPDPDLPVWYPVDMRLNLGRYDRILVLDFGLETFSDEEILTAFDLMGVVLEFEKCSLDHFRGLVRDFLT
jgi:hypothetical protein